MLESLKIHASFRLIIIDGRAYVHHYHNVFQTAILSPYGAWSSSFIATQILISCSVVKICLLSMLYRPEVNIRSWTILMEEIREGGREGSGAKGNLMLARRGILLWPR
ncbi:hypothetical protein IEQ34_022467 [Dendrobium chrysotoxum]|uniref:Uncharacterized protein n=1 Tax=Dendrobium chrysotoxum TaxID=161865 RepID=A0AAV7FZ24_DENCH|nr:hypothetical protein IEQ34_022467 [Dendrobium chrysotoxum]